MHEKTTALKQSTLSRRPCDHEAHEEALVVPDYPGNPEIRHPRHHAFPAKLSRDFKQKQNLSSNLSFLKTALFDPANFISVNCFPQARIVILSFKKLEQQEKTFVG